MLLAELRAQVVQVGLDAVAAGIADRTAGNMSLRDPASGLIAISPSGMRYPEVTPADVVVVDDHGRVVDGHRRPSTETPLHTMVYRERPWVQAIVHTHSHYATVVSCIRPALPPILTEISVRVGGPVPVTRYGGTGTDDLGRSVIEVLADDGRAVLMKNHGVITFGATAAEALTIARVVEETARVYIDALAATGGQEPEMVPAEVIPAMRAQWQETYGQPE